MHRETQKADMWNEAEDWGEFGCRFWVLDWLLGWRSAVVLIWPAHWTLVRFDAKQTFSPLSLSMYLMLWAWHESGWL